jgi:hypothetical protein
MMALSELENAFGISSPMGNGFQGRRVIEIGGGYGNMAHTFATFHDVKEVRLSSFASCFLPHFDICFSSPCCLLTLFSFSLYGHAFFLYYSLPSFA